MFKKTFAMATMLCVLPVMAHAWTLNTWVKSAGGYMQSPNVAGNQTSANGSVTRSYTTTTPLTVTVTPNPGFSISVLSKNGLIQTLADPTAVYSTTVLGPPNQSVQATFARTSYTLSASAGAGGTVSPASITPVYLGGQSPAKVFTYTPSSGYSVQSITVPGHVLNSDYQLLNATTNAAVTLPAATNVSVKVSIGTVKGSAALTGTFFIVGANAGPSQTVLAGAPVTLDGSASTGATTYAWTRVSGPATVTLFGANTNQATFTAPATLGNYVFRLTINGGSSSATTTVSVTNNIAQAGRSQCENCHSTQGIGTGVFANWSTSDHKTNSVMCYNCHIGANSGGHPGTVPSGSVNENTFNYIASGNNFCATCHDPTIPTQFAASAHSVRAGGASCSFCHTSPHNVNAACVNCHTPGNSLGLPWPPAGLGFHNDYTGTNLCSNCHNLHNPAIVTGMAGAPHYNNITGGMYPASYMSSRAACADCHYNSAANASHRQEWNKSGHAATTDLPWIIEDFKTKSDCVQCHTTTGFIAYSTGKITAAWGVASDKTKEVLRCNGCHKDVANGVVRTMAPVRPYADDPYINRDVGKSNLCMACHSGRRNGASITAQLDAQADFTNLEFIDPHNHASGGNLHARSGYHFPGQSYAFYSTNTHRQIGIAGFNDSGTSGPCIACHRNDTNAHTNKSLVNTMCGNCHGASFTTEQLYIAKQGYTDSLAVLNAMLVAKGHLYSSPTAPYFSNTNWGSGQDGANTMGAAFNYVMLHFDNGAYAHNTAYAKELISDSIDYLYNGSVTGSIDAAVNSLVGNGITQAQADSVLAYQRSSSCTDCHANTSRSHPAHLNSSYSCDECHNSTAQSNNALVPGNVTHLNGAYDLESGPGRSFTYTYAPTGGTCSSISCHNYGSAVWGSTLGCDGCHDAPPATASHLKHYGGTIAQAGYGNTGSAQNITPNATAYIMNCGNCHPMDKAKHGNGIVDIELHNPLAPAGSLKGLNPASAAYVAGDTVFVDARGLSYTKGTCSSIYCHSYNTWTTNAPIPADDPNWQSKVVVTRMYRDVTWGGAALNCSGCHGNPTQTDYTTNDGGAGDSHAWIDDWGYGNLHTFNHSYQPVSCSFCHNDTVKQVNTYTRTNMDITTLGDVPISNFSKHINGSNDVSFNKQNFFNYSATGKVVSMDLSTATYAPETKTCSNVACHLTETTVKWGRPYRLFIDNCDRCHGYGSP